MTKPTTPARTLLNATLATTLLLTACTSAQHSGTAATSPIDKNAVWVKYFDRQGGVLQAMHFLKKNNPSKSDIAGIVRIKNGRSFGVLPSDGNKRFTLLDNNSQNDLLSSKKGVMQMMASQSIRFFEFGDSTVTVADFNAPNGVCKDYSAGVGVNTQVAINVYKNYDVFATAFTTAKLSSKRDPLVGKATLSSYPNSPAARAYQQKVSRQLAPLTSAVAKHLNDALTILCNNPLGK